MTAAVVVDDLSKRDILGRGGGYRRLTEVLADRIRRFELVGKLPLYDLRHQSLSVDLRIVG